MKLTPERLSDLIVTCFEGGSTHWLEKARPVSKITEEKPWYSDPKFYAEGFEILLRDDEGTRHHLNWENVRKGCGLLPARRVFELETENWDAETADVFLQLAVLGEVVYG
jgi:hypothetical protein